MAAVTITNLTTSPLYLGDLYTTLAASASITVNRYGSDLSRMKSLQDAIAAGTAAVSVVPTANELASGLMTADSSVQATDLAAVAATAAAAAEQIVRKSFTTASTTDIVIYAANSLPYKMRIIDAFLLIGTPQSGSAVQLWSGAAGTGTAITGSIATTSAGKLAMPLTGNTSIVLTPGALVGLYLLPNATSGVIGEIEITLRRES